MYPVTCRNCGELNLFVTPPPERVRCQSCGNVFRTAGQLLPSLPDIGPRADTGGLVGCLAAVWGVMAFVGLVVWLDYRENPQRGPAYGALLFYGIPAIVISLVIVGVFVSRRSR